MFRKTPIRVDPAFLISSCFVAQSSDQLFFGCSTRGATSFIEGTERFRTGQHTDLLEQIPFAAGRGGRLDLQDIHVVNGTPIRDARPPAQTDRRSIGVSFNLRITAGASLVPAASAAFR